MVDNQRKKQAKQIDPNNIPNTRTDSYRLRNKNDQHVQENGENYR